MTADTNAMREAASQVSTEKGKFDSAVANLNSEITKLGQYWIDESYDEMKASYDQKDKQMLIDLGTVIAQFSSDITVAADELDSMFR